MAHRWVGHDDPLHLNGELPLAATLDHILAAVCDLKVPKAVYDGLKWSCRLAIFEEMPVYSMARLVQRHIKAHCLW